MEKRDAHFMRIAINAAKNGVGKTFPRPSVGAVLVNKQGNIISIARTADGGAPHAEPQALEEGGSDAKEGTLYVTLEPCNHHGRTPPCADAVIASGIKRLVIANRDANPKAAGGLEKIKAAGIEVTEGICAEEAMQVNGPFFSSITKKRPYVIAKIAVSLDGKIALANGESKYITGKVARDYVHVLRNRCDGILVGVNTVINDDPQLNCRLPGVNKQLIKVVVDTHFRIPKDCGIIKSSAKEPVIVFSSRDGEAGKAECIKAPTNKHNNFVDLYFVMKTLAERGFERLLVEGGARVISSFLKEGLIDELQLIYAPKILGSNSISFSSEFSVTDIPANQFCITEERKLGEDLLVTFKRKS